MKAAQHIDGFRGEASVRTWLHTIDTNECCMLRRRTRREVVDALTRLPEHYQKALVLKDGCGPSSAEVARLLQTTVPAAKSILFRARRSLRDVPAAGAG